MEPKNLAHWLIVGLGNPGRQYERTRHNIGFHVVEKVAAKLCLDLKSSRKFKGRIASGLWVNHQVTIVLPDTYMNRSGDSVAAISRYYRIDVAHLLVVHDEVDMPFGRIKLKVGGGDAGHRGLRSMIQQLGSRDFVRLRVGVGRPDNAKIEVSDWVLSRFSSTEQQSLDPLIETSIDAIRCVLENNPQVAMNSFNSLKLN